MCFFFCAERPIRNFEMLSGVCGSWNSDKTVNLLVIKKTLLAPLLAAVPLQIFALELATAKGYDVDQPRNLAKSVTVE